MADVADREYAGHAGLHRQGRPVERPAGRQASAAGEVRNHRENAKDAHQAYRRSGLQVRRRPRWHSHPGGEAGLAPIKALSYVKRGLEALKIRWIEIEDAKADDVIATPVSRVPAGRDILITSGDRDKYQLVADRVLVLNTAMRPGHRLIGPKQIEARYGVPPSAWCCRTGLAGDPSDGIKGIPGIGPATASASFRAACTSASGQAHRPERAAHSRQHDGCCPVPGPRAHAYRHPVAHAPDGQPSPSLPAPADVVTLLDLW